MTMTSAGRTVIFILDAQSWHVAWTVTLLMGCSTPAASTRT
jgi:hypothetical protein